MPSFDPVVEEYDSSRPTYPPGVFDALGRLGGAVVLEGGAGTGIATRDLLDRGARVIPFDIGPQILRRAVDRSPGLPAVVADGARLPFRDRCADLICFAQSWHWLDPGRRSHEAARVLRPGGRWAGWWSHARADGEHWFESYWSAIERACPGTNRSQRDTDWGSGLHLAGCFDRPERITVPWERRITTDAWLTDQASHSYVMALGAPARADLLDELDQILGERFPSGEMRVSYETWLWIAARTDA